METAMNIKHLALASLALGLLAQPVLADKKSRADRFEQRRALVTEFAGAPRASVSFMRHYDFEPLGEHTLLLYESINRAYLLEIEDFCPELTSALSIGIDNKTSTLSAKFDSVKVRGRSCRILEIRPVDVKAMKAAQKQAREAEKAAKKSV
jgi:Family of unknown function (DUF6491)